jgi:hypothetical protein
MHGSRVTIIVCLLAVLAGCGSAAGNLNGSTPESEVKVSASSSSPASPPPRGSVTVTEADQGSTSGYEAKGLSLYRASGGLLRSTRHAFIGNLPS